MQISVYAAKAASWMAVLSVVAAIAWPPALQSAETYHLGVALGLTRTGAEYSKQAVEGIEMAVNEINAAGGLLGRHPIRLYIRDTRTVPPWRLRRSPN